MFAQDYAPVKCKICHTRSLRMKHRSTSETEVIQLEIHLDNKHHVQQTGGRKLADQMKHVIPYITLMIPLLLHNEA